MTLPSPLLKFLSFPWPILIGFINPSKDPVWPTYTTLWATFQSKTPFFFWLEREPSAAKRLKMSRNNFSIGEHYHIKLRNNHFSESVILPYHSRFKTRYRIISLQSAFRALHRVKSISN